MGDDRREMWVNTLFRGADMDEFLEVKEYLGIQTNTDVVRHLVRQAGHQMRKRKGTGPLSEGVLQDQSG